MKNLLHFGDNTGLTRTLRPFVILIFLLQHLLCAADGGFVPPVTIETLPEIPSQTALIIHKDGIETLIVESVFQPAGGDQFAWIVPVPAVPNEISATTPGVLRNLQVCFGPDVISHTSNAALVGLVVLLICIILGTLSIVSRNARLRQTAYEALLMLVMSVALWFIVVGGPLGGAGSNADAETLVSRSRVGNYEIAVLNAKSTAELSQWLQKNGFGSIPEPGLPAAEAYAKEGWSFVVAKLLTNGTEPKAPHPLSIEFPSAGPVYPMRLTAMAGSSCQVDLFIAAANEVSHPLMECVFSDRLGPESDYRSGRSPTYLQAIVSKAQTRHSKTIELLGTGTWLTRLRGTFRPSQMSEDVVLKPVAHSYASRKVVYTPRAAAKRALIATLLILCLFVPVAGWVYRADKLPISRALAVLLLVPLSAGAYLYATAHKAAGRAMPRVYAKSFPGKRDISSAVSRLTFESSSLPELEANLAKAIPQEVTNFYTEGPVQQGDGPGDFEFVDSADGRAIRVYNLYGDYDLISLPSYWSTPPHRQLAPKPTRPKF